MKVAYIFSTNMASTFKLATMILPQLEADNHGAAISQKEILPNAAVGR